MNIIVLENEPSSYRGGQEKSLFDVCQGLAYRGHKIYFLYVTKGDLLEEYQKFCHQTLLVRGYFFDKKNLPKSILRFIVDLLKVPILENTVIYSNQYHDSPFGSGLSLVNHKPYVCHLRLPPYRDWETDRKSTRLNSSH